VRTRPDVSWLSWSTAPEVATPRLKARTLVAFYLLGGTAGLLIGLGAQPGHPARWTLVALSIAAFAAAAVVARWAARWPRAAFHVPVGGGTALVVAAVAVSPDPVTALACASVVSLVVVDACFFFRRGPALLHVVAATVAVTTALLLQGDVPAPTALALDVVLVALGGATRSLVARASSARLDPLTGLTNRRGFDEGLQELAAKASRSGELLSAALLDLDFFKEINDSRGHEAGDRVLCRVAEVWRRGMPSDAVLARHGGDEFSLLLPRVSGVDALVLVRRLCADHPDIRLSSGVAEHAAGESGAQLMRRADHALYRAKAAGRNRAELDGDALTAPACELAAALAAGEVEVVFQPVVLLPSAEVTGLEALARWRHPARGPVPPEEFIALAEQHGMIAALGEHVLRTACRQLAQLSAATGCRLDLGVNVSGLELSDPSYPGRVRAVLAETGFPADQLLVEVTESVMEAHSSAAVGTLHALRADGLRVAIDDFGTGYSSLSRLDTLPVDGLKLDASFTATITTAPRRAQLLTSMVAMADAQGLFVVCEGVETDEQAAALSAVHCRLAQGWLYGRPTPLAGLADRLGLTDVSRAAPATEG